jgi:hypothetical protein
VTSQRQIDANRRNARKSTGPRTPEGKAVVAQNAVRHGLLSAKLLIDGEEEAELFGLAERLRAEYRPEGEFEELLVEDIVATSWRLRRVPHFEAALLRKNNDIAAMDLTSVEQKFELYAQGIMGNLSRYEAQLERRRYTAWHELKRLQAARADAAASVPPLLDGKAERSQPAEDR